MKEVDPQAMFRKQIARAFVGALIFPVLMLIGFFVFLFILSFTHLLGGPYGIARFFFWFLAFIYGSVAYGVLKFSLGKQKTTDSADSNSGQVFRDAEVVEK